MRITQDKFQMVFAWIVSALWMAVIFMFSSDNAADSGEKSDTVLTVFFSLFWKNDVPDLQAFSFWLRKAAHFAEYFILGGLVANAWRNTLAPRYLWRICLLSVIFCAVYAATDEIHQMFVPGRAARLADVAIDSAGAAAGTAVFMLITSLWRT
ncbi:MAG: VanZ family protein [Peptococcaceae bacterium]|jgi:VanZ family protein|nr:VanZ family protein [Peptococcaceae bacterium]